MGPCLLTGFSLCLLLMHFPGQPPTVAQGPLALTGLPNCFRLTEKLYSGGNPDGQAGFDSLQKLGIKTIISVDGAKPDIQLARKYGMRYVHLPIGYDGVPRDQGLRIAKAVRDLPGPVYIHCHHGKHRSPAAAAIVMLCLDERCPVDKAVAWLRQAGTDPKYLGLHAAPQEFLRPSPIEWNQIRSDFPETAKIGDLMQSMVDIDERWDHLQQIKAASWRAPPAHPDLDPAHEALMLWEHYVEISRLPEVKTRPQEFHRFLKDAQESAQVLERLLREMPAPDPTRRENLDKALSTAKSACVQCHATFRDVPQPKK